MLILCWPRELEIWHKMHGWTMIDCMDMLVCVCVNVTFIKCVFAFNAMIQFWFVEFMTYDHNIHVNMSFCKILFFSMLNLFFLMMMIWCFWGLKAASPVSFPFSVSTRSWLMGACGVTLQWVNVCCMMNEIFTHLHTRTSRVQHKALGAFSESVASAVLEVTGPAASLSLKANRPPHHFGINPTETAWHSPNGHAFTAAQALTVYVEMSFEMFASRLQPLFPVWSLSLLKRGHKRHGLGRWGRLTKQRLLCFHSRLDRQEKLFKNSGNFMQEKSQLPPSCSLR